MSKKTLKFSVYQLIIDESEFALSSFTTINDEDKETDTITPKAGGSPEVLSIRKIKKTVADDRFVSIYINEGDKFPYSKSVIDSTDPSFGEKENPRPPEQIELDDQFFVLFDVEKQRVFMSDGRKKSSFNTWLSGKLGKQIVIKSIIQEDQFIEKIKSVSKISFTVSPTLFNSTNEDILSHNLVRDIFGFGAEKASIELDYGSSKVTDQIIQKFNSLMGRKNEFDNIVVIGRSEEDFESIFNLQEIVSRILVDIDVDDESKQLDSDTVFSLLIQKIEEHENH